MIVLQCKRDRLAVVAIAWVAKETNACVSTVALLLARHVWGGVKVKTPTAGFCAALSPELPQLLASGS